jgi:hypothetical protein
MARQAVRSVSMPELAERRCLEASRPRRVGEIASWGARLSLAMFVACSSGQGGGGPGPSTGDWTGTQSCNGWTLSSVPGAPPEAALPVAMMDVSASGTQTSAAIVITGLTIGPLAGWSCPDQTIVGSPSGPADSNGVTYFSASKSPCLTTPDDAGFAFDFTASGDTYSSNGHETVFLSLDLSPVSGTGTPSVTAVGSCTIYLTQP